MFKTQVRDMQRLPGGRVHVLWSDVGTDADLLSALERGLHANRKYNADIQIIVERDYKSAKNKVVARIYK